MFARTNIAFLALLVALSLFAAATPLTATGPPPTQCNTGNAQCCNSTVSSSDPVAGVLIALLNIVGNLGNVLGLQCSPITGIGAGGTNCGVQTVCCDGDTFGNGLVTIGCTPITVVI